MSEEYTTTTIRIPSPIWKLLRQKARENFYNPSDPEEMSQYCSRLLSHGLRTWVDENSSRWPHFVHVDPIVDVTVKEYDC